jgi:translation initiation factor 4A
MANIDNKEKQLNYQDIDYDNFDDFLCSYHKGDLLRGIYAFGFERPSPIQAKAIQPICDGRDLVAQAQSGSGKTATFVISALTKIDMSIRRPQAIIIANTRELAAQIETVTKNIGKFIKSEASGKHASTELKISLCIGGSNKDTNTNLKEAMCSHVLIGTPGRLLDLIERDGNKKSGGRRDNGNYSNNSSGDLLDELKILVLDEADKLLGEDFRDQIHKILKRIPVKCQVCLFSATFLDEILDLTKKFLNNPVEILVDKDKFTIIRRRPSFEEMIQYEA